MTTTNEQLAAECRAEADRAMRHRRAWLSLAVLLDTTRTIAGTRAALARYPSRCADSPATC